MVSGQKKTQSGEIVDLDADQYPFDTRLDIVTRFGRGKFAPVPALAVELLDGQKLFGNDITFGAEFAEKTVPLYLQDMVDVVEELGVEGIFMTAPFGFFGVGIQAYPPPKSRSRYNF